MRCHTFFPSALLVSAAMIFFQTDRAIGQMITVEPDDFANGQNISTAVPGVTLSAEGNAPDSSVYSVKGGGASTGVRSFGYFDNVSMSLDNHWHQQSFPLRATFDMGVASVSLDFTLGEVGGGMFGDLRAFNSANVQIDAAFTAPNAEGTTTLTVSSPTRSIAYIRATFAGGGGAIDCALDNMVIAVPEPSVLALLGLGVISYVGLRRRTIR